jgi:NADPH-dependent 2,4-dienoyl-CoA reductase/sulfur reductase-like enzyme
MKTPASQIVPHATQREIGRGGKGVVYLARDTRLDRQVAIKALPEHLSGDAEYFMDRRRFLHTGAVATAGLVLSRGASFSAGRPKQRVVVLGAGLAGLTAAWELDQAGHEVVVIEGRRAPAGAS